LKRLPAPAFLSLTAFLLDDKNVVAHDWYIFLLSFFVIDIPSKSCTVRPVNDLKSNGFLDNLS
jgi:hypothetical protein